jgi:hypothetical protein
MNYLEPRWNLPKCVWTYLIIGTRRKDVSGKLSTKNYLRHTLFEVHLDLNFSFCTYICRDESLAFAPKLQKRTLFSQIWAVMGSNYTVFIKCVDAILSKIRRTIIDFILDSLLENCLKSQLIGFRWADVNDGLSGNLWKPATEVSGGFQKFPEVSG